KVSQGTLVLLLEGADAPAPAREPAPAAAAVPAASSAPAPAPARAPAPAPAPTRPVPEPAVIDEPAFSSAHASPAIRRMARELGVDLGKVRGSGPKGRVLKEDVQAYVKQALAGAPAAGGGAGLD